MVLRTGVNSNGDRAAIDEKKGNTSLGSIIELGQRGA